MSFKFPWSAGESSSRRDEASITDVLPTPALRTDLLLLVVLCTDLMRDNLTAVFEPTTSSNGQTKTEDKSQSPLIALEEDGDARPSRIASPLSRTLIDLEIASPIMQSLKRSSVTYFNTWRTRVLRRFGNVLSVTPDTIKRAKANYQAGKEAALRARRQKEYYDWAEGEDSPEQRAVKSTASSKIPTSMLQLDDQRRALVLHCCLLLILSLENYPAHSRVLLQHLTQSLEVSVDTLSTDETVVAQSLLEAASNSMAADNAKEQKAAEDATARKWKVGLATVAGATLVGVTGGLAAPFLLGIGGAIMGGVGLGGLASLLGATIANPLTIAALFGALGGKMSGQAMEEYAKEVEDFKFVPVHDPSPTPSRSPLSTPSPAEPSPHKLRVTIGISGWLTKPTDVTNPWLVLSSKSVEPFALRYERTALLRLGTTLDSVLRDSAYSLAQASFLQVALPAVITASLLPVSLLKLGRVLDNPFSVAMERSEKAGRVLATALIGKAQGERPVSLIGYSLGARVVWSCCQELAERQAFGLVESVILIGGPVPSDSAGWRRMRAVVMGRVVNVYTTSDLLLGFLYRTSKAQVGVAGLSAIEGVHGVESFDVSHLVKGHNQYRLAVGAILKEVEFEDLDLEEVERETEELRREDKEQREIHKQAKEEGKLQGAEDEEGKIIMVDADMANESGDEQPLDAEELERMHLSGGIQLKDDEASEDGPQEENSGLSKKPQRKIEMQDVDPEPEPDPGPQTERVRFGSSDKGFDLTWDRR